MQESFGSEINEKELKFAYRSFINDYTQKRNIGAITTYFSYDITNIGSGEDEVTLDYNAVVDIFKRDIEQCPEPMTYDERFLKILPLNGSQALLISVFDTEATIKNVALNMRGYRFSMIWEKTNEKWLIRHIHLSKGENNLREGESFPLSEIEEKNQALEKLVNKRTKELWKLNMELADANKDIKEIKQRFETIFEKASDGIIVADWKSKSFFMINQRICDILGYSKKEFKELWFTDLIPNEHAETAMKKILQESNGDLIIADDIPVYSKDKTLRYFDIATQPIKIERKNYLVSLYRDITDYKKTIQLKQQAEVAQKASEAKNLFLANMSHEIRTPVTGIMGMSEILQQTRLDDKQKEYLSIIKDSSTILLSLINDILDISKIEAGKLELKTSSFKLSEITENIKTLNHSELLHKGNTLDIHLDPLIPEEIIGDKMRVEQVLMNLVNNAIKFTENGTINIDIKKAKDENDHLLISVKDSGIGISDKDQAKLFQKFQQVDSSLSRLADGSGLGLFICRQLVNLMNGHIGVTSKPGKGSTFWFTFEYIPIKGTNPSSNESFIEESDISLDLDVLLVDDKKVNLQVISLMLQTSGCKVDTAINGLEALDKFNPEKHKVVLMDIMMPLMDGITAMKELRKKHNELPPIIAITANAMTGDKEKYLNEGFDAYITKPVTMQKLSEELNSLGVMEK